MFDLSQANYLLQHKPRDPNSSLSPPHNPILNHHTYHQPCNSYLDYPQKDNFQKGGKWSLREIMRYYSFLVEFKYLFKSKELRKTERVFSQMSKHIRSRKTSQCKSHHQKVEKYYGSIENIISHYKAILSPLKQQWKEFERTQNRALINEFPQLNKMQNYYEILEFKNCIKIYINESSIKSYEI